ncbi:MAG TPA: MarR family transcriptional regulator, partial [Magnetospirillum sp.]|nr:MarR family transcriptional regulator [Magnetospirillum sp.]
DKLETMGLIERRPHPTDRRIRLLFLTEAAHPLLEAMRPIGEATRAEALEGVSQADQEALFRTLTAMKSNLLAACERPIVERSSPRND